MLYAYDVNKNVGRVCIDGKRKLVDKHCIWNKNTDRIAVYHRNEG